MVFTYDSFAKENKISFNTAVKRINELVEKKKVYSFFKPYDKKKYFEYGNEKVNMYFDGDLGFEFTIDEFCKLKNCCRVAASKRIHELIKVGRVRSFTKQGDNKKWFVGFI